MRKYFPSIIAVLVFMTFSYPVYSAPPYPYIITASSCTGFKKLDALCHNTTDGFYYYWNGSAVAKIDTSSAGAGNVTGPAASTDAELPLFSGAGGNTLKRSNTLTGSLYLTSGVASVKTIGSSAGNIAAGDHNHTGVYLGVSVLDDTKGNGDTAFVWSADKVFDQLALKLNATALDDTKGNGDTTYIWSADKVFDQLALKIGTTLADGTILVGNVSNVATAVTPSGDVTMTNAGVTAIGSKKVAAANIADNTITAGQLAAALTFSDSDFIDLSAITMSGTNDEGIALPVWANVTPTSSTKHFAAWDATAKSLKIMDAGSWYSFATVAAPVDSPYLVIGANDATLTGDRKLVAGVGLSETDGGANGSYTLALDLGELTANQNVFDGGQATQTMTFRVTGTDPVLTFSNGGISSNVPITSDVVGAVTGNASTATTATGSSGSVKSPATSGVSTFTGPAAGTTRAKTVRDADDTILELGGSYTPTGTWTWSSVTWASVPTLNQNTSGTAANLSGTPTVPNGTAATTQAAHSNDTKLATDAYADALVNDTAYAASWDSVLYIAPSKNAVYDQMELRAPKASPTFTGTVTMPAGLTGILRSDTGVVSVDTDVTDIVAASSTSAAGKIEIATNAETTTGTDTARAVTPDDLAYLFARPFAIGTTTPAAGTFTGLTANGNLVLGDADTDTATVRSMIVGGNSREVQINAGTRTAPSNASATPTQDLYVAGNIETPGTIYAAAFSGGTGTDGSRALTMSSNTTFTPSGNQLYFLNNVAKLSENGTAKDIVTDSDSVTWTGTTHSFAGVTNMVLPTAAPDAVGEIGYNATAWAASHGAPTFYSGTEKVNLVGIISTDTCSNGDQATFNTDGTWTCESAGGSIALSSVTSPAADATFTVAATNEVTFNYTGNYTTGSQFLIEQKTGNPTGGVLFEVKAADSDTTVAKFGDGTNGVQVSTAGMLSAIGTGGITATAETGAVSGATSIAATTFIAVGADPADAGAIRLSNAGYIYSEASPAGTDVSVIGVDSSEAIQIGASGASGVTITPATGITGAASLNGGANVTTALTPNAAGAATLGTTALEWGNVYLTDSAVIYGQADQSNSLTSAATGWTANLLFTGTGGFTSNKVNAAGGSANSITVQGTLGIMDGSDTWRGLYVNPTNANHTGTGNTVVGVDIGAITGDANSNLYGMRIGALTGTSGAAGEVEDAIIIGAGWDADIAKTAGILTIGGSGSTNNEKLTLDFETTANKVAISSTSGVTDIDAGSINLITTGNMAGGVNRIGTFASPITSTGAYTLTAANCYNSVLFYNDTDAINLPAAVAGMSVVIYVTGTNTTTIEPNGSDVIVRDGTAQSAGVNFTVSGAAGNYVALLADAVNHWITLGFKGTLTQGS